MSEYQYYEFQALDRPLSPEEQAQLRAISTRARITATRFTNTYEWGDLKGDPRRMTERYFDAHLYVTNWGTHRLMLRLPEQTLSLPTALPYCLGPHLDAWTTRTHILLDLTSEDEDGDWVEGADDSLAALIGVRDELATGDLRPLYLAWLSALTAREREDDDEDEYRTCPEPPVPAGLGDLTAPQRALADFLRVDTDLLAIAAQTGPAPPKKPPKPAAESGLHTELLHRLRGTTAAPHTAPGRRTTAQLLDAAHTLRTDRRRHAEAERATARARHLTALADQAESVWQQIETHIATRKPSAHDRAVTLLADLRDACADTERHTSFHQRLTRLREANRHRPGLIQRLDRRDLR
ncbi:hypothetical protein DEJ49_23765 [Streptomyces venezuelae]|uniref:Uncharacterized protein n=1 Tax=Streptomyces venezuelae TaxID=54571 RepID=A0A5P2CRU7_STRVZ|nr:hypothetical protein [Streptomyces venezuelae]QES43599.1 hypothetical protein DEJ49_23765 [Streptomyces venezuelae]